MTSRSDKTSTNLPLGRPVHLTPHDPDWKYQAEAELLCLKELLPQQIAASHHIGSTAIPGMMSKPIIDLLLEINSLANSVSCVVSATACAISAALSLVLLALWNMIFKCLKGLGAGGRLVIAAIVSCSDWCEELRSCRWQSCRVPVNSRFLRVLGAKRWTDC